MNYLRDDNGWAEIIFKLVLFSIKNMFFLCLYQYFIIYKLYFPFRNH